MPTVIMYINRTTGQVVFYLEGTFRRALFETHPDRGGDADVFRLVVRAKDLLAT